MGCVMFFTKEVDIFGATLDMYRSCFTKPQWNHFNTYLTGLLLRREGREEHPGHRREPLGWRTSEFAQSVHPQASMGSKSFQTNFLQNLIDFFL